MTQIRLLLLVLLVPIIGNSQKRQSCSNGSHTLYSYNATSLDEGFTRLSAPDGKKMLIVKRVEGSRNPDGIYMLYSVKVDGKSFKARLEGFDAEVAWSPDSQAFAVTETEGGGSLGSRVYVFYVTETGLRKLDVSRPIEQDFGNPVKCEIKIVPNTGFVSWQGNSQLLVAAEVVPVSICECMGTYRVYAMRLPDIAIEKTYSQREAKKQFWSLLGCELRGTSDACVSKLEYRMHRAHN